MFLVKGSTVSSANQKNVNRTLMLNAILRSQPISQVELTKTLKISKSTVSRITQELMQSGMLKNVGVSKTSKNGRNPSLIALNPEYRKSLVIKVGVNYSMIAIANFSMSFEKVTTFKTKKRPEDFIDYVIKFIKRHVTDKEKMFSVSLSIPGIVEKNFRKIVITPNLGWKDLPLAEMIEEKLDVLFDNPRKVSMDNEANLAVIAEMMFGKKINENDRNVIFILFGEGIGTGLVINGQLYRGRWNTAGEFGHMIVEMNGKKCHCGNRGCWERYASISQIAPQKFSISSSKLSDVQIGSSTLEKYSTAVATGIANIVNGISPDVVIVGGTISKIWNEISQDVIKKVKKMSITSDAAKVRIESSSFSKYPAELYGAAVLSFLGEFEGPIII
ncbi:ROK family transcriptional regulator [Mesoaciditoga lauensis]|uniref:ROK family transcriptional regulator n=1 Tax=Mesoaciditoga lauensis TaxID=1495039 RepID=UPI00056CE960|nr:ROK family transcriptional regulator [Mesoaciditoga lauensis]